MAPFLQCFAQSPSGLTDYVIIRNYNYEVYPLYEDSQYSPHALSNDTGDEDIIIDSAISSEQVIGEIRNIAPVPCGRYT